MNLTANPEHENRPLLHIENLRLESATAALVEDISLEVGRGEMVGLLGESGCGKTITALAVLGLLPAHAVKCTGGRIVFEGHDISELDEKSLNRVRGNRIAMIFQEPMTSLNPIMTIGAQIGEALEMHRNLSRPERIAETCRLLDLVGLPSTREQLRKYPFELSGGQRQRVMIAMALACEPALLIADEPTTALDVTIQAQILELIGAMRKRFGMACILVTHDLGVVAETCDRAVIMYAGRIVERGSVGVLFSRPIHRYTEALIGTIPAANQPGTELPAITGAVPPPGQRPAGCAFAGRCAHALEKCVDNPPPAVRRGEHIGHCWNPAT